ncbi:alpha/beta fold hydrolase [Pararhizobium sp. DWP1-1-3]|uniref:alpha/beta fold hydrolase n=1 Tax=Pararhizobium sp. DWP1-1-3 TaxID=2804652 RepID=UPI003CF2CA9F
MSVTKLTIASAALAIATTGSAAHAAPMFYRSVTIDGLKIAYRETGSTDKPAILLLHGVPSSSRMYDGLMQRLGDQYHLVAPDYPGFGNSDAPPPKDFAYTFDNLAEMMLKFTDRINMNRYVLFMQDYGAPIGMRLAIARPSAIQGTVFQNGNVYSEGLGPIWENRKAFWSDRAAHEQEVRKGHLSLELTRARHLGSDPDVEAYNPDLWMDEFAYLNRPGQAEIQSELIYDYQNNIASYPLWQKWLRDHRLPALVIWGKYDLAFTPSGADAFKRDLPNAQVSILNAGHFAMDTHLGEVADLTADFLERITK